MRWSTIRSTRRKALVQEAGQTMQEIVANVQRVTGIMAEISQASSEQIHDIEQINQAIVHMEDGTQQNTALVEQAAAAAVSLQDQATHLAHMANAFTLDGAAERSVRPVQGLLCQD